MRSPGIFCTTATFALQSFAFSSSGALGDIHMKISLLVSDLWLLSRACFMFEQYPFVNSVKRNVSVNELAIIERTHRRFRKIRDIYRHQNAPLDQAVEVRLSKIESALMVEVLRACLIEGDESDLQTHLAVLNSEPVQALIDRIVDGVLESYRPRGGWVERSEPHQQTEG
jgi:hypothetical protein